MRLDKYLSAVGAATRSEAQRAVRERAVLINGVPAVKVDSAVEPGRDRVLYRGVETVFRLNIHVMLNKPEGYVSATDDSSAPYVTSLLNERDAARVFPCGRLDKYTTGLMLLTDDGVLSHRLLSPTRHVAKTYRYTAERPLDKASRTTLEGGVHIAGGYMTAPCVISTADDVTGEITITEGKYHQIKQMFRAVGNSILTLERITFGPLTLDASLARGEWRYLTDAETESLYIAAGLKDLNK